MKGKVWGIGLVLVLIGAMVGGLPASVKVAQASPGTIWVNTTGWWHEGGNFNASSTPIQDALDTAIEEDTIIVKDGTYDENVVVGVANLTIQSENGPASCIVSASTSVEPVFNVTASYVNITGFTIQNATGTDSAGIYLNGTGYCNITGNNVTNNYYGIYLHSSSNNTLTNNSAYNNTQAGIYLSSSNDTITGNNVTLNGDGIYLDTATNMLLEGNTVTSNTGGELGDGIRAAGVCNDTVIRGNNISYNNFGIDLFGGDFVNFTIANNTVSDNPSGGIWMGNMDNSTVEGNEVAGATGDPGIGIVLVLSDSNNLTDNTAYNNAQGIYLGLSSSNNNISSNNASANDYGIWLESSSGNTIYNNYFNNTNNAWDDGNNIWNITKTAGTNIIDGPYLGGNYWSDYVGSDTNHDGLGDTLVPYNSTGDITSGGDYLPLVSAIYATIEGMVYEANASVLADAAVVLKLGGSEVANTTTNASGYYIFSVTTTGNYTVNVTSSGLTSSEKEANIAALGQTYTIDFKGMDAPYRTAPDALYCLKCSNLWLYGAYHGEFALDATRVSDVLYAWTHPS